MKKLVALTAALAFAAPINFAIPTAAAASNNTSNASAVCKALGALGYTQGNCVEQISSGATNANLICHFAQSSDPALFAATWNSFGACVAYVNFNILGKL
jgi:hypothetical protein